MSRSSYYSPASPSASRCSTPLPSHRTNKKGPSHFNSRDCNGARLMIDQGGCIGPGHAYCPLRGIFTRTGSPLLQFAGQRLPRRPTTPDIESSDWASRFQTTGVRKCLVAMMRSVWRDALDVEAYTHAHRSHPTQTACFLVRSQDRGMLVTTLYQGSQLPPWSSFRLSPRPGDVAVAVGASRQMAGN